MGRFTKIFSSELFFLFLVIVIGMGLSLYPMFYEIVNRNHIFPDRQFVLVYNFAPDFNAYLSKIIQGIQGQWLVREYFTSEPHQPSLLQIFYLLSGRAGGLFSTNPEFTYHAIRIIFAIGWIVAGWFFIKYSFASEFYRKVALLFFVFGGNFPKLVQKGAEYGFSFLGQRWEPWMVGWSNLDPVKRMTFIPHWNAGHVMTVISLLCLVKFLSNLSNLSNLKWFGLSVLFGIFAGLILPPTLVIVYVILGLWVGWEIMMSSLTAFARNDKNLFISALVYLLLTFPTLLYNLWVTGIYPWKSLVETDLFVNKIAFPYFDYLMGLGPLGSLGILGGILVLLFKKEKLYMASFWVLGMFALIIFFDKVINWHNQTRFLEVGPELPLSILSVFALHVLFGIHKKVRVKAMVVSCFGILILSAFMFAISIKAQVDFIKHKMLGSYPELSLGNYVVYPYKTIMEGVDFIKNNATFNEVTLSGPVVGNHIGAYAGRFVYIGHGSQTVRFYQEKLPAVRKFYAGLMSEEEVKSFVHNNRIKFVFYGPEEKGFGDYPVKVDYLVGVFRNRDVVVYQVENY